MSVPRTEPVPDGPPRGVGYDDDLPEHVHRALTDYLQRRVREVAEFSEAFRDAAAELDGFVLGGGKRLRPTFAWWGWRAVGGAAHGPAAAAMLRAASSLELLQACALVHDDLIDDSDTRRGNPTVHRAFARHHREAEHAGRPEQFGMTAAVLLGDLALTWSDDMFFDAGLEAGALRRGMRPWQAMRTEVLGGQYLDVLGQAGEDESAAAALRVCALKSASYTVQRPLELGAEIAGGTPEAVAALRRFGSDIGVAFQLRDDLLGVFGDPAVTGKPAGDDLREGKRTVLVAEAFDQAQQRGDTAAAEELRSALGDPELTGAGVRRVRELLHRVGADAAVERRISELTGSAMHALRSADLAEPAATRLAELAVTVTDRAR
ncbi:polyprenyl synthetase family protein [Salinifilum aidingensis]